MLQFVQTGELIHLYTRDKKMKSRVRTIASERSLRTVLSKDTKSKAVYAKRKKRIYRKILRDRGNRKEKTPRGLNFVGKS